jgi:hypothetical protein
MSRNINVNALLEAINADLDKLGANKGQRSRIEKLAKAAGAEPTTSKRKTKKVEKKPARGKMFKEDKPSRKSKIVKPSKKDKTPKRNIRNKHEREDRKTSDDNKVVVKHARLRAVKVKKTREVVETPSKIREEKKRKHVAEKRVDKRQKQSTKQASEKRVVAKNLKKVVKKLARAVEKVAKKGRK